MCWQEWRAHPRAEVAIRRCPIPLETPSFIPMPSTLREKELVFNSTSPLFACFSFRGHQRPKRFSRFENAETLLVN